MPDARRSGYFRADIFEALKDRAKFKSIISQEFHEYALTQGCLVQCSNMRLYHAHHFFVDDLKHVLGRLPDGTEQVDHLKFGAFLGFWLRRMLPINYTSFIDLDGGRRDEDEFESPRNTKGQDFFATYGNEYCSFRTAFDIAQYVHLEKLRLDGHSTPSATTMLNPSPRAIKEIVVTLKHKNNSPHSFYTTLLALFETLTPVPV